MNAGLLGIQARLLEAGPGAAIVLRARAREMTALIREDPAKALSVAFSPGILTRLGARFPPAAPLLEAHGTWEGPVHSSIFDYPDGRHIISYRMRAGKESLEIHFAGGEPSSCTGAKVTVTGVRLGDQVAAKVKAVAQSAGTSTACSTTGAQNIAVLLITFPGVTLPTGVTAANLDNAFFGSAGGVSLDGFLQAASYGQTWATGNTFGSFTLTGTYTSCSDLPGAILNDAITAAIASGVNFNAYDRGFLVFPDIFGCGWAGFVPSGCSISWSGGTINVSLAYTVAADMATQNGDYWSTMGEWVLGLYPAPQEAETLGWLVPSTNYQAVQSNGTYSIQPLETSPPGLQAFKVQRGIGNNEWLWIEYRQPMGSYDSTLLPQPFSGALIHYEDANTPPGHTYMPNFTPTDTTWNSPALAAGQSWADVYTGLSLSVSSATASGLTVNVTYGPVPCVHARPNVTVSPLNPSVAAGMSTSYTVSITNNDTSGCAASTFGECGDPHSRANAVYDVDGKRAWQRHPRNVCDRRERRRHLLHGLGGGKRDGDHRARGYDRREPVQLLGSPDSRSHGGAHCTRNCLSFSAV
jgi:hypothetical protein